MEFPPILKPALTGLLREPFVKPTDELDESIHDFFSRRFNPHVANALLSAIVHGIYAGDSRQLSIKSCFPMFWNAEKEHGSIIKSMFYKTSSDTHSPFVQTIMKSAIYSFEGGMETLVTGLVKRLNEKQVPIHLNMACTQIQTQDSKVILTLRNSEGKKETRVFDRVISTLPTFELARLVNGPLSKILNQLPYANVTVINVIVKNKKIPDGFGYLVSRTEGESLLGVVYDSKALPFLYPHSELGVVTIMVRGLNPSNDTIEKALKIIQIDPKDRVHQVIRRHEQCIPQYPVGHEEWKEKVDSMTKETGLSLAGAAFSGVSVNDCILGGKRAAKINIL
jgi:oxygen-dependent protoporphyrinogen oxidase